MANDRFPDTQQTSVRIWDLPVRIVHWLIVLGFLALWGTAEYHWMTYHKITGYTVLMLVLFRLYWGLFGSTTARFTYFLCGPVRVWRYAKTLFSGTSSYDWLGHNPLGGWSVVIMFALLLIQVGLGLFAGDIDGIESGPLARFISFDSGRVAARLHDAFFNVLLFFIILHIAAIGLYLFRKKENLVLPMLRGVKKLPEKQRPHLEFMPLRHALIGMAGSAGLVMGFVAFFGL